MASTFGLLHFQGPSSDERLELSPIPPGRITRARPR